MKCFENVETAVSYDFWCSLWVLSNVIGRTVRVERPHAPVYLNLYAILSAESGVTRKSSAVRFATALLSKYTESYDQTITVIQGGLTAGSLDNGLAKLTALWDCSRLALSSSELVSLLGRGQHSLGLPGKLTDLYDCPDVYTRGTKSEGVLTSRNVYVTLLGASTPSWLVRAINPDVVEGGFTSRCLFIIEERPKRLIAWPDEARDEGRTVRLLTKLDTARKEALRVQAQAGGIRLTRIGKQLFTDWYETRTLSNDPFGASFQAREDHHILRLAGLMSASDGSWEIDEHHLTTAMLSIEQIKDAGSLLFGSGVASSKTYALVDRIRGALVSAGRSGLSQTALSGLCRKFGTSEDQRTVLTVMHEMDLVQKFHIETGDRGRPTTMYRATKALANARALEEIVDSIVPQEVT